jgi:methyltransferase (TIGR00027 family)
MSTASRTAYGPMVIAAVEQYEPAAHRILDDPLAVRLLPPALATIARAGRWRRARELLVRGTESTAEGLWAAVLCRKRYADEQVAAALADGIGQLLVLGAGLDTRAYRLAGAASVFEVDVAANVAAKGKRVRAALGAVPANVRLVAVDFEADDLAGSLAAAGFRADEPVMVVWEAVTQYLTEDAVRRTLAWLATTAPGSRLAFSFVRSDFLDGTNRYGAERMYRDYVARRRVWHFGLSPAGVAPLLAEYGWTEHEQLGPAEYRTRYLEPAGRRLPISPIERFVTADKTAARH